MSTYSIKNRPADMGGSNAEIKKRHVIQMGIILLLTFLLVGCGAGEATVSGDVTYRQRIALPDDAVVTVIIQDVSIMDVATKMIDEQVIQINGAQVPIPYEVPYDLDEIDERHTYSMSARIEDSIGKLLFISDTAIPVITNGNPTVDVEIVVVPVSASG